MRRKVSVEIDPVRVTATKAERTAREIVLDLGKAVDVDQRKHEDAPIVRRVFDERFEKAREHIDADPLDRVNPCHRDRELLGARRTDLESGDGTAEHALAADVPACAFLGEHLPECDVIGERPVAVRDHAMVLRISWPSATTASRALSMAAIMFTNPWMRES